MKRYYFNSGLNVCAERQTVVDALYYDGEVESREEAEDGLDSCRCFRGWFDCEFIDNHPEPK